MKRRWVPLPLSEATIAGLLQHSGGHAVTARLLLERLIGEAIRDERRRIEHAKNMATTRQQDRFGWRWR